VLKNYIIILLLCFSGNLAAREVVIAFENTLQPSASLDALARSQMLVRNMDNAQIPQAMFLIKTRGLTAKDGARLRLYSDAGHLLVNAGHSSSLVAKADLYQFEIAILKANRILKKYKGYKKHIHFSYLKESGDPIIQEGLRQFLEQRHYLPSYTGFNAMRGADGYFDQLFQEKVRANRHINIVTLEKAYVEFVTQTLNQQDALLFNLLGYSPKQVLVLQETDLSAYFIAAVVERLQKQKWTIIPAERAFTDPIANPVLANGYSGNGYLNRISELADAPVAYPRLLGERKLVLDKFLQAQMPELLPQQN
jgi:hypothetical protein